MSDRLWTNRRPGEAASIANDEPAIVIGDSSVGDVVRVPQDWPDESERGMVVKIVDIRAMRCPKHLDHAVKTFFLERDIVVCECDQFYWGRLN